MKVSVFGLGYVGAVSAGCMAQDGHDVIGVDVEASKINLINEGKTPIIEKDIGEIIETAVKDGKLRATADIGDAIRSSEISLVCVGTPSRKNGSLDLSYVQQVCAQIGDQLASKDDFHCVVMRSTMLPGTMDNLVIPTLEEYSGKKAGIDFGVCNNPEFLRESTAVWDYYNPPKTVIGDIPGYPEAGDKLAKIYENLDAIMIRTDIQVAEMVKYTDNVGHAVKVSFANEIGNICKAMNIDSHKVMDIFCQDTKLNLSPYYLKPGFAFGGSCLPKDVRALTYHAKSKDVDVPVLNALLPSNENQIDRAIALLSEYKTRKVGILGFAFKAGTDDLRESPVVTLIEYLLGKGYELKIYDKNVELAGLVGANRDYLMNAIPHIYELLESNIDNVFQHSDVIVVGNKDPEFSRALIPNSHDYKVLDLVRLHDDARSNGVYQGLCW
ncbi:MAG: nucleotide sugar dehydrogenase [Thiotrichales bacterium]